MSEKKGNVYTVKSKYSQKKTKQNDYKRKKKWKKNKCKIKR